MKYHGNVRKNWIYQTAQVQVMTFAFGIVKFNPWLNKSAVHSHTSLFTEAGRLWQCSRAGEVDE